MRAAVHQRAFGRGRAAFPLPLRGEAETGAHGGQDVPVRTFTPLLGAEILLEPRAELTLTVDPAFAHGFLVDTGEVHFADAP
ncbi:hypothetical protein [Streptomyces sp. NBC_00203]|uniref:hypothetical protein n=1 Tax=Streptomyces sp. NBC_00203 TaxID=2975680 RepID=UPI003869CB89